MTTPSQRGRTVVVTGAGRGVGYFVAEGLAAAGARVVLTTRSASQAEVALASIRARVPDAQLEHVTLDLASLASVRTAAKELAAYAPIDVLVNNAGRTSAPRRRETTADGFETMVGTNAYGPFALTALLWPSLSRDARVIWLGSLATRLSKADLADLQQERGRFSVSRAYAASKHAVHAIALELDRRARARGLAVRSILAHPGFALDATSARRAGITDTGSVGQKLGDWLLRPMAHGKDRGAAPVIRAATDPDVQGGQFFGPRFSTVGRPAPTTPVVQSAEPAFGAEVWRLAEEATGVTFDV